MHLHFFSVLKYKVIVPVYFNTALVWCYLSNDGSAYGHFRRSSPRLTLTTLIGGKKITFPLDKVARIQICIRQQSRQVCYLPKLCIVLCARQRTFELSWYSPNSMSWSERLVWNFYISLEFFGYSH